MYTKFLYVNYFLYCHMGEYANVNDFIRVVIRICIDCSITTLPLFVALWGFFYTIIFLFIDRPKTIFMYRQTNKLILTYFITALSLFRTRVTDAIVITENAISY